MLPGEKLMIAVHLSRAIFPATLATPTMPPQVAHASLDGRHSISRRGMP
jgi:hypothetical protein